MYQTPEQLIALSKANIDVAVRFANVALQGAERLIDLQLAAAKSALAEGVTSAKALTTVKDVQDLAALKATVIQPNVDKANSYARGFYDVAAATQAELNKLVEEQIAQFNKNVTAVLDQAGKTAPAGSEMAVAAIKSAVAAANSAYDNVTKTARQFADLTESSLTGALKAGSVQKKKAA
jgi:phasin family protein